MKKYRLVQLLLISTLCVGQQAAAQHNWNLQLRTAADFPTQKLGTADLNTGFGLEGAVGYKVLPKLIVNAGWGWNRFTTAAIDYEETGYTLGVQFFQPITASNIEWMVGAGPIYNHIEMERDGNIVSNTGHGFGWQVETGIAFPISSRSKIVPTVRYRELSREFPETGNYMMAHLKYVSAGVGFFWSF